MLMLRFLPALALLFACATASAQTLVGTEPYIWAGSPETSRIFSAKADGSSKRYLTPADGSRTPEWTCDGKQIIFASKNQIWIMNADGTGKRQLTNGQGATAPSIACNGKLLFGASSPKTRNSTLWVMDTLTSAPRQLSPDDKFDVSGRISPDGTKVAFARYFDFNHETRMDKGRQLFVVNADGTGERQLTFPSDEPNAPHANAPAWAPDSKRIAYFNGIEETGASRDTPDIRHLAVINADGTGRRLITRCNATKTDGSDATPGFCADDPVWWPDGNWIMYSSSGMSTWFAPAYAPQKFIDGLLLFGGGGARRWTR